MHLQQLFTVNPGGFHAPDCDLRAIKRKSRIVELDTPATMVVEILDLLAENFDQVGKILRCNIPSSKVR